MEYWTKLEFKKENGKLKLLLNKDKINYKNFLENIKEGETVEGFFSIKGEDKSLAQLAKVHVIIRTLANELGYTFSEMKKLIKDNAGLYVTINKEKEYKSFSECSKSEIASAIQCCIEIGNEVGVNLA
jgi:hypothetical protein